MIRKYREKPNYNVRKNVCFMVRGTARDKRRCGAASLHRDCSHSSGTESRAALCYAGNFDEGGAGSLLWGAAYDYRTFHGGAVPLTGAA